ncbi:MAG: hypothetical protein ACE5GX_05345 [Thermoanaerobaculia bacterium]
MSAGFDPVIGAFLTRSWHSLAEWLVHRRLPTRLALIAVVLCLPALGAGFQLDDYMQRMIMLDRAAHEVEAMEAFSLMRGESAYLDDYIDWGVFPWWTADNLRLSFLRYLTVATVWIDYRLWPDSAALMHAHSLAWLGGLIAVAALLYRRMMGSSLAAGLAGLLYAIDEAHAGAAAWLANRNALTATFFGVLCLVAHDRWRRSDKRSGAWAGPVFLAMGLASGEMALSALGYLAAYALFVDPSGPRGGTTALGGHGAVVVIWAAVYRLGGFGTRGSGLYLDPIGDAAAYLAMLPERLALLLLGQWSVIPADAGWLLPADPARRVWLLAVALIVVLAAALAPLLRRDRIARFWALGMVLSLLPVAATFPSNRLLFFVGVGAMGLIGQFVVSVFEREPRAPAIARFILRSLAILLLVQHLLLAPLMVPAGAHFVSTMGEPTRLAVSSLPADSSIAGRDLVIVNTPDYLSFVTLVSTIRAVEQKPYPPHMRTLSAGPAPVTLERLDAHTVRVSIEGGLYAGPLGELFRSHRDPLDEGSVVEVTGMTATVVADDGAGVPTAIDYRFVVSLEDPSLYWVRWEAEGYVPVTPPVAGESLSLAPAWGPYEQIAEWFAR